MNNIVEKKEIKGDIRANLKDANRAYTECISKEFLGRFLAGEKVTLENFCVNERTKMKALDEEVYGKTSCRCSEI
jgi:hypothetical protein